MLCYRTSEEDEIHCLRGRYCVLEFLYAMDALAEQPLEDDEEDDDDEAENERLIVIIFLQSERV